MRNGQFSYNKRGTKNENFNKTYRNGNFVFYSTFLYEVGLTYEKLNILIKRYTRLIYEKCEISL